MDKNEKKSFIYNFDILSGKPGLFISGQKNYSSLFGLIATFLILFFSFIYALYALYI